MSQSQAHRIARKQAHRIARNCGPDGFYTFRGEFQVFHYDKGDPWGSTMGALFDISGELYHRGEGPPDEWEFSPGAGSGDMRELESGGFAVNCADATTEELRELGELLWRLRSILVAQGREY